MEVNDWQGLRDSVVHRGTMPGRTCPGRHSGEGSAARDAQCHLQDQVVRGLFSPEHAGHICMVGREGSRLQ